MWIQIYCTVLYCLPYCLVVSYMPPPQGVYWPRKRSSWIANALENFAARPWPSLCEIWKASSLSLSLMLSEKKGTPSQRPRPRFRPRFSDLSFHLQPWLQRIQRNTERRETDRQQRQTEKDRHQRQKNVRNWLRKGQTADGEIQTTWKKTKTDMTDKQQKPT